MKIDPYLAAAGAYDSNVFALSSKAQAQLQNGDSTRGDGIVRAAGGANASYLWSRQELDLQAEGRRYEYAHFQRLDHNEYLLSSTLKWALGNLTDGTVNAQQDLRIAPFEDRDNTQFAYSRERAENGTFNFAATPEWRLESGIVNNKVVAPLEDGPNFSLLQNSANLAVKYLGVESLAAGLYAEYLKGKYSETGETTKFDQITAEATSKYTISGLSSVDAKLGYTSRSGVTVAGLTGMLNYSRVLSGKTNVDVQVFRRVSSYTAGAGSQVETGAGAGLSWRPTYKIDTSLRYDFERSEFQNQGSANNDLENRKDSVHQASLLVNYQAFNWLAAQSFLKYQVRDSNVDLRNFDEFIIGLQLRGHFGGPSATLSGATVSDPSF